MKLGVGIAREIMVELEEGSGGVYVCVCVCDHTSL